jgi:hypothetical protein
MACFVDFLCGAVSLMHDQQKVATNMGFGCLYSSIHSFVQLTMTYYFRLSRGVQYAIEPISKMCQSTVLLPARTNYQMHVGYLAIYYA